MSLKQGEDLLKYVTERTIHYINTPREERKSQRNAVKGTWKHTWFGMLPLAFQMWMGKKRK